MLLRITKAKVIRTPAISARTFLCIAAGFFIVGFVSVLSAAQVKADPTPDEHHPPSVSDIERMERNNPRNSESPSDQSSASESCLLPPLDLISSPVISTTQLQATFKAKWEYHRACASLRKRKNAGAAKHLLTAVSQAPRYAIAWVTLGQVLDREQRTDEARRACLQASTVDPTYIPAYLCLADIAARDRAWDEVLRLSSRAIELVPSNNAVAYEYRAAALLNLHQLEDAEKIGLRAVELDTQNREPRTHFVLAQIYEAKGDSTREILQLREYLHYAQNPADIATVREVLVKLETHVAPAIPLVQTVLDSRTMSPSRWAPADIDESVPPVLNPACPLARVLEETSRRAEDLIDNLQRFSANERIELTDTDPHGKKRSAVSQDVNYVAQITRGSFGYPHVEEYRSGVSEGQSAVLDSGIAAFALIFHPTHIGGFEFRCEGQTELRGVSVWQLHFEESADPKKAFTAIRIGRSVFLPRFKGRAWVATDRSEVLRVETDLSSPIPEVDLQLEHMIIDYAPVEFSKRQVRLWLPDSTTVFLAYRGHHYERSHKFTQFQLFLVDAVQSVQAPVKQKNRFMP